MMVGVVDDVMVESSGSRVMVGVVESDGGVVEGDGGVVEGDGGSSGG